MARSDTHICSTSPWTYGRLVNAYVRLGTPSRWIVIGRVCADCGHFTHRPLPEKHHST